MRIASQREGERLGPSRPSDESARLRLEIESARSENEALRSELDRLLEAGRRFEWLTAARSGQQSGDAKTLPTAAPRRSFPALAERYRDALSRSVSGDGAASEEAYDVAIQLFRAGPAAFPALRDAYLATSDPRVRSVMVRAFGAGLGPEAAEFIAAQLRDEKDADLRAELVERASRMSTPATAAFFRDAFLDIIGSDAAAEARIDALRGLRYLREDDAIDQALLAAARDSSEDVRIAAIEELASRPELRGALEGMVTNEASKRVRQIGECRLLLTESRASL